MGKGVGAEIKQPGNIVGRRKQIAFELMGLQETACLRQFFVSAEAGKFDIMFKGCGFDGRLLQPG